MISSTENNEPVPIFLDVDEDDLKQVGDYKPGNKGFIISLNRDLSI